MNTQQELIEIVSSGAGRLGIDIMLIGAFARDYWCELFGLQGNTRTTYDVDFSCQVIAWSEFAKLFELLKNDYGLRPEAKKVTLCACGMKCLLILFHAAALLITMV